MWVRRMSKPSSSLVHAGEAEYLKEYIEVQCEGEGVRSQLGETLHFSVCACFYIFAPHTEWKYNDSSFSSYMSGEHPAVCTYISLH